MSQNQNGISISNLKPKLKTKICLLNWAPEHVKDMRIGLVINATGISESYRGHVRVVNVDVKDDPTADIHSHFKVAIPKN